jgi:hypothetical protein
MTHNGDLSRVVDSMKKWQGVVPVCAGDVREGIR